MQKVSWSSKHSTKPIAHSGARVCKFIYLSVLLDIGRHSKSSEIWSEHPYRWSIHTHEPLAWWALPWGQPSFRCGPPWKQVWHPCLKCTTSINSNNNNNNSYWKCLLSWVDTGGCERERPRSDARWHSSLTSPLLPFFGLLIVLRYDMSLCSRRSFSPPPLFSRTNPAILPLCPGPVISASRWAYFLTGLWHN